MEINLQLKHPPSNIDTSPLSYGDAANCLLFGTEWFADFRSKYGHLILAFQELEQELKTTLYYMEMSYKHRGIDEEFESDPQTSSFEKLIQMFSSQLGGSSGGRDLVGRLHQARKYRNRLAHEFLEAQSLEYHLSAGGRAKTIQQLDLRLNHLIPLVMIVHRIGKGYAADIGRTEQVMDLLTGQMLERLGIDSEENWVTYVTGEARKDGGFSDPKVIDLNDL